MAKDENGNFMIESIEDLVVFSAMVNGGYSDENINISSNQFLGQTVLLMRNLDFKSNLSYENSNTTIYNGYLGIEDDTVPLIEALTDTTKYQGFIPIGKFVNNSHPIDFKGTFCGNNKFIKNLNENLETDAGLFGSIVYATIKDISVSGEIKSSKNAGGIVGYTYENCNIINCTNFATVISETLNAGGITGGTRSIIQKCSNKGNIQGNSAVGGISGYGFDGFMIQNCDNSGTIVSNGDSAGGIIGIVKQGSILNCYNTKEAIINSVDCSGEIVGETDSVGVIKIYNCYNLGRATGTYVGGIVGSALWNNTESNILKNSYYLKSSTVTKGTGKIITDTAIGLDTLTDETIDQLNLYIDNDSDSIGTKDWLKWNIDSDGNPLFIKENN